MNATAQLFNEIGEPFAAGFFEFEDGTPEQRYCRAYRRYYETCPMSYVEGSPLYPSGPLQFDDMAVVPQYHYQYTANLLRLKNLSKVRTTEEWTSWQPLADKSPEAARIFEEFHKKFGPVDQWCHSVLNYKRILEEGVERYEQRVQAMKDESLRDSLMDVLIGLRTYHGRVLEYLRSIQADKKLIAALEKVPYQPAETVYEALVSWNFMLYLDGCDDIGPLDNWLLPYWKGEDLTPVLRRMMQNMQDMTAAA